MHAPSNTSAICIFERAVWLPRRQDAPSAESGTAQQNGQPCGVTTSSGGGVTVVVDRSPHAAAGLPTSYGIVTPIYKE